MAAMARKLRIQDPGAVYHVMYRDDRREAIFRAAKDYGCFLQTLAAACEKARWQVQAWCLMPNHLHLVLETPQPTRVAGMKWLICGEWRIPKDSAAGRRAFAQGLEGRRREDLGEENRRLERGWFVGDAEFRQELLAQVVQVPGANHFGEAVQAAVAVQAERLVQDRLQALGWQEGDLTTRRKGDPAKVELAAVVRAQTTMPLAWIAKRLAMGSRGYLTWLLYRQAKPS
jgi:REP element-mobilizing transposase RayT